MKKKPLLFEPGTRGHRKVIRDYLVDHFTRRHVSFHVHTEPLPPNRPPLDALDDIAVSAGCDVIHILTFEGMLGPLLRTSFLRRSSLPVVASYYLYNNLFEYPKAAAWDLALARRLVSKVLVSDPALERRRFPAWKAQHICYVPDPWEPDQFPLLSRIDALNSLALPVDTSYCLMFGDLSLRKGVDLFLDALIANLGYPEAPIGLLVGRIDQELETEQCRSKMTQLQRAGRLHLFTEYIPELEVSTYFCAADLVVCPYPPSFKVSSGTFTRACAAGKPVILPETNVLSEIVKAYNFGYTYNTGTVEVLAQTLRTASRPDAIARSIADAPKIQSYAATQTASSYASHVWNAYRELE